MPSEFQELLCSIAIGKNKSVYKMEYNSKAVFY